VFDQAKLDWLNGLWLRATPLDRLAELLGPFWERAGVNPAAVTARGRAWLVQAAPLFAERAKTLLEMARAMAFLFAPPTSRDAKAEAKFLTLDHLNLLGEVRRLLAEVPVFTAEVLEDSARRLAASCGKKLLDVAQPVRVALTGSTASPPLFPVLALMGQEVVLERIDRVLGKARPV
jgi:glutamyl-tRNA synthetase